MTSFPLRWTSIEAEALYRRLEAMPTIVGSEQERLLRVQCAWLVAEFTREGTAGATSPLSCVVPMAGRREAAPAAVHREDKDHPRREGPDRSRTAGG